MNAKKIVAALLAVVLLIGVGVGGTLAWLTAKTTDVVNTFTTSDIDVKLVETTTEYKMIPGWDIAKDPKAWIEAGSEAAYLFVKVESSANFGQFMTYEMAEGWKPVPGQTNVYYKENAEVGTQYPILKDNKVTVKTDVTKEMMNALTEANYPKLTFTAYASQLYKNNTEKFTPEVAWTNLGA